jgi:hypothetical protein
MSTIDNRSCDSLYNISLNRLDFSTSEEILDRILKLYAPSMLTDVIWKVIYIYIYN